MSIILPSLRWSVKQRLLKHLRACRAPGLKNRYLIVLNLAGQRTPEQIASILHVHRATIYRVAARFRQQGELGLFDRRRYNGPTKIDRAYREALERAVRSSPQAYGWSRPTWTRELLVLALRRQTGVRVHVGTLSRVLHQIRARRGRPRPTVRPPHGRSPKRWRLYRIRQLLQELPSDEVAVYADEVDIHLNPKIGWDWMAYGQQKKVPTPGQNRKRYLAGALDATTEELIWVSGAHKDSALFIRLLVKLWHRYPKARVLHVIVDNYSTHSSALTRWALGCAGGRIRLHPLPTYSPQYNKIERVWEDLHANVTRNHTCPDLESLMGQVRNYLRRRLRQLQRRTTAAGDPEA
jgi:transposase